MTDAGSRLAAVALVIPLAVGLLLPGCAAGPDYKEPTVTTPDRFSEAAAPGIGAGIPDAEWWQGFGDPELDALIQQAAAANYDVRISVANLRASRALLREGRQGFLPTGTVSATTTREKQSQATGIPVVLPDDYYDAGFDAVWELDFFGRIRRSVQALNADYGSQEAQYRDTLRTVVAEVARTYVELRGVQYRLAVAERNIRNQEETYGLTLALLNGGRGTDLDIARALAQLETTRASMGPLQATETETINRLAVLVGGSLDDPAALRGRDASLPQPPTLISVADPASLLRRRPDIRAAERQLAAATARTGVAVADYFPTVSIIGSAGWRANSISAIGDAEAERYIVGPRISWGVFDLGRIKARVDASDARTEAALAFYEKTVTSALQDTESALARYVRAQESADKLKVAADASSKAAELARLRYRNGVDSFLTVLDAERRQLEAEDLLAGAETDASLAAVAVYKSLGGGWEAFAQVP